MVLVLEWIWLQIVIKILEQHYATTLKSWRTKFLDELEEVRELGFSNEFINMWEFYFVYCEAGFRERNIGDYQFIFAKPDSQNIQIDY